MVRVVFAPALQRHVELPPQTVAGVTLREVLDHALGDNPRALRYILDDQRALRHHMLIFIDGVKIADRVKLSDAVKETSNVYVMQSLSGG